ncbi:MAG TPA: branched-chain amino acid ABC transporter substrate-binding protein [Solirubrobacteraceae bacterium]|nr:branched-chain amino acid ABC transporter substrate-binding protein [Solirubrobacteraceae bacterium]
MRLATCKTLAAGLVALSAVAVAACGRSGGGARAASASTGPAVKVVDIYSSLPLRGPSAADAIPLEKGIRLALEQAGDRAGAFAVRYISLDDSAGPAGWDPSQTAADARQAAADPKTVFYIGEFDDQASEVSMPILNVAGIPQVSPANTYVGLTTNETGASGRVTPYAPSGTRTYLRIVPTDAVQAGADLLAMKQAGCTRVALADDGEEYGVGLAKLVEGERRSYGVDVVTGSALVPSAQVLRWFADMSTAKQPDCVLLAGVESDATVRMTKEVHLALPAAKIFAPAAMCTSAWTNPRDGGVPATIDPLIECTAVTLSLSAYPGGKTFRSAYEAAYGVSNPSPYAILGYEAMSLGLSTIASLGPNGDSKSAVLNALFSTTDRHSVLGTYGFDREGDTTLRSIGLYKVGATGSPEFVRTITPPRVS